MRTRILRQELGFGVLAATAVAILVSSLVVHASLRKIAVRGVRRDLELGGRACARLAALEKRLLSDEVAALVEVSAFRGTMTASSVDGGAVLEAARNLRRVSDSSVLLVTDASGRLLADVGEPARRGDDLGTMPGAQEALRGATRVEVWSTGGREVLVGIAPIFNGDEILGLLAVGEPLDETKAKSIRSLAGTDVLFLRGSQVISGSWAPPTRSPPSAEEIESLRSCLAEGDDADGVVEGPLAAADRLSTFVPLTSGVDLVLSEDIDPAMEPLTALELLLLGIGAATASLAILLVRRILGRLERPIRGSTLAAGRLASVDVHVPDTGPVELRQVEHPPSIQPSIPSSPAPRVLLVDDNPVDRRIALRMLEVLGCQVDSATDGRQAVEACRRAEYDAVLMDCRLPVMDGYEATRSIRNREKFGRRRVRIHAVTANAHEGDRERCLTAGMDGHVPKPVTLEVLRSILAACAQEGAPTSSDPDAKLAAR